MIIRIAQPADFDFLVAHDPHISHDMMRRKIDAQEIFVISEEETSIALLRWSWFWDNVPFMNLLRVLEAKRGKGIGRQLVAHWEVEMQKRGAAFVLTSTYSHEEAQHFYRKCGYQDIGGFVLPNEPMELILFKKLSE